MHVKKDSLRAHIWRTTHKYLAPLPRNLLPRKRLINTWFRTAEFATADIAAATYYPPTGSLIDSQGKLQETYLPAATSTGCFSLSDDSQLVAVGERIVHAGSILNYYEKENVDPLYWSSELLRLTKMLRAFMLLKFS